MQRRYRGLQMRTHTICESGTPPPKKKLNKSKLHKESSLCYHVENSAVGRYAQLVSMRRCGGDQVLLKTVQWCAVLVHGAGCHSRGNIGGNCYVLNQKWRYIYLYSAKHHTTAAEAASAVDLAREQHLRHYHQHQPQQQRQKHQPESSQQRHHQHQGLWKVSPQEARSPGEGGGRNGPLCPPGPLCGMSDDQQWPEVRRNFVGKSSPA
mmetsp:Transcript_4357/g.8061  ORF Transcript_4357/g.8061 Transcript_4357/m.8061 type:complete len:208 (-) Transcript_4357:383-1006(-)